MARTSGSETVEPLRNATRTTLSLQAYDAIGRIKTSQSQSMIDTDFEYGLQPTRWINTQRVNGNFIDPVSGRLTYSGTSSTIIKRETWKPTTVFSQDDYIYYSGTSGTAFSQAIALLRANKNYIIAEAIAWQAQQVTSQAAPYHDISGDYLDALYKCERDIGFMFDALILDIPAGNERIRNIASKFWSGTSAQIDGHRGPEIAVYLKIKEIITSAIFLNNSWTSQQTQEQQIKLTLDAETGAAARVKALLDLFVNVIGVDPSLNAGVGATWLASFTTEDFYGSGNTTHNGVFLIGTAQTYTSGEDVLDIANNALYIPSNVYRVSASNGFTSGDVPPTHTDVIGNDAHPTNPNLQWIKTIENADDQYIFNYLRSLPKDGHFSFNQEKTLQGYIGESNQCLFGLNGFDRPAAPDDFFVMVPAGIPGEKTTGLDYRSRFANEFNLYNANAAERNDFLSDDSIIDAPNNTTTVYLPLGSSDQDDFYNGWTIIFTSGPGSSIPTDNANTIPFSAGTIQDYVGTTRAATIQGVFMTTPNTDTSFVLIANPFSYYAARYHMESVHSNVSDTAQPTSTAGATIRLGAGTGQTNFYKGHIIRIIDGKGAGQERNIVSDDTDSVCVVNSFAKLVTTISTSVIVDVVYNPAGNEYGSADLEVGMLVFSGSGNTVFASGTRVSRIVSNTRIIISKPAVGDLTTSAAQFSKEWEVLPDTTSRYIIIPAHAGVIAATGSAAQHVALPEGCSHQEDFYNNSEITIIKGADVLSGQTVTIPKGAQVTVSITDYVTGTDYPNSNFYSNSREAVLNSSPTWGPNGVAFDPSVGDFFYIVPTQIQNTGNIDRPGTDIVVLPQYFTYGNTANDDATITNLTNALANIKVGMSVIAPNIPPGRLVTRIINDSEVILNSGENITSDEFAPMVFSYNPLDNYYKSCNIRIYGGAGEGQERTVKRYIGESSTCIMIDNDDPVDVGIEFQPSTDDTSLFELSPSQAVIPQYISEVFFGKVTTITDEGLVLNTDASKIDEMYTNMFLAVMIGATGTLTIQSKRIKSYKAATRTVAFDGVFNPSISPGDTYCILPLPVDTEQFGVYDGDSGTPSSVNVSATTNIPLDGNTAYTASNLPAEYSSAGTKVYQNNTMLVLSGPNIGTYYKIEAYNDTNVQCDIFGPGPALDTTTNPNIGMIGGVDKYVLLPSTSGKVTALTGTPSAAQQYFKTDSGGWSPIKNYYKGAYLQFGNCSASNNIGEIRQITSFESTGNAGEFAFVLDNPLPNNIAIDDVFVISFKPFISAVTGEVASFSVDKVELDARSQSLSAGYYKDFDITLIGNTVQTRSISDYTIETGAGSKVGTVSPHIDFLNDTAGTKNYIISMQTRQTLDYENEHTGYIVDGATGGAGVAPQGKTSTIKLDPKYTSEVDGYYCNWFIRIIGGDGTGQEAQIIDYVGSQRQATVAPGFYSTVSDGSKYLLYQPMQAPIMAAVDSETSSGQTVFTTFSINAETATTSLSTVANYYKGYHVRFMGGGNVGKEFIIDSYDPAESYVKGSFNITTSINQPEGPSTHAYVMIYPRTAGASTVAGKNGLIMDQGFSSVDESYTGRYFNVINGAVSGGTGQTRHISSYDGYTRIVTFYDDLTTALESGDTFCITEKPMFGLNSTEIVRGEAVGTGSNDLIQLPLGAAIDETEYVGALMHFIYASDATVQDHIAKVTGYNPSTREITFLPAITTNPSDGDIVYIEKIQSVTALGLGTTHVKLSGQGVRKVDQFYQRHSIKFTDGANSGSETIISDYDGDTGIAMLRPQLDATAQTGDSFELVPKGVGIVDASLNYLFSTKGITGNMGDPTLTSGSKLYNTVKFGLGASRQDTFYRGYFLRTIDGVGAGQENLITDYNGATRTATVNPSFTILPDQTTHFFIQPPYSVHMPYRGGVEMRTNTKAIGHVTSRQTKRYFRYQAGKGVHFSFGLNFGKPTDGVVKRAGQFDDANGIFWEYRDGEMYAVRRNSNNPLTGVVKTVKGSPIIKGTGTKLNTIPAVTLNFTTDGTINDFELEQKVIKTTEVVVKLTPSGGSQTTLALNTDPGSNPSSGYIFNSTYDIITVLQTLGNGDAIEISLPHNKGELNLGDTIVIRGDVYRITNLEREIKGQAGDFAILNRAYNGVSQEAVNVNNVRDLKAPSRIRDWDNTKYYVRGQVVYYPTTQKSYQCLVNHSGQDHTPAEDEWWRAEDEHPDYLTYDGKLEWNKDNADGTGLSTINADWTKIQMYMVDYAWYGAGGIYYGIKGPDAHYYLLHIYEHGNVLDDAYLRTPNLPVRYEVANEGTVANLESAIHFGTSMLIEGRYDDDRGYAFVANSSAVPTEVQGRTPLLSVRPAPTASPTGSTGFGELVNRAMVMPESIDVVSDGALLVEIIINGQLDPVPNWSLAGENSVSQYSTNSNTLVGGETIFNFYTSTSSSSEKTESFNVTTKDLTKLIMLSSGFYAGDDRFPYGPDTFTVVVTPVSESGTLINKACASLSWTEAQS